MTGEQEALRVTRAYTEMTRAERRHTVAAASLASQSTPGGRYEPELPDICRRCTDRCAHAGEAWYVEMCETTDEAATAQREMFSLQRGQG